MVGGIFGCFPDSSSSTVMIWIRPDSVASAEVVCEPVFHVILGSDLE